MALIAMWEPGYEFKFHGADAQKVYEEIKGIGPSATPEQIVDKGATKARNCTGASPGTTRKRRRNGGKKKPVPLRTI